MLKFNKNLDYKILKKYGFDAINDSCYELELFNCNFVKGHEMDGHVSVLIYTKDSSWNNHKKNDVVIWVNLWTVSESYGEIRECDDAIAFDALFDLIKDEIIVRED